MSKHAHQDLYGYPGASEHGSPAIGQEGEVSPRWRRRKHIEIRVPALNITSFLDMSFCLLMFLTLSASFSAGEGVLTANLPVGIGGTGDPNPTPETLTQPLHIIVSSSGGDDCRIQIEELSNAPPTFTALVDMLTSLRRDPVKNPNGPYPPETPVTIKPSSDVKWQHVVNAFNSAIKARFENVAFAEAN
jgi:biopolymer transport protein ExbD